MNHVKFTSPNNSSSIKLLISEFNKYKNDPNLAKYSELVSKFLELLNSKKLLKELDSSTHSFRDSIIEKEFIQLIQYLKSTGSKEYLTLQENEKIINSFFLVIYYQCYIAWFKIENSPYEEIYSESISVFNKNFNLLDNETTHIIIDRTRFIPKQVYDTYMKNNQEILNHIKNMEQRTAVLDTKIQQSLDIENDIETIEKRLLLQRQEFNFIGLSDAFQKMQKDKQTELEKEQKYNGRLMGGIGLLLVVKLLYALFGSFSSGFDAKFAFISLSSIFLIAVLIYFFRISLINIKSIKSQILQLDLRLSLCQFIHHYAEDSKTMRNENMKDSLDRFESIIFSPIVANEEQIPATFDNLDQFIKMMNIANGGKAEEKK